MGSCAATFYTLPINVYSLSPFDRMYALIPSFLAGSMIGAGIFAVGNKYLHRRAVTLYCKYQSYMHSYEGQNMISSAEYAKLLDSVCTFARHDVPLVPPFYFYSDMKKYIHYLESNNMYAEINTLLKMGAELSDFDKTYKTQLTNCGESASAIDQLFNDHRDKCGNHALKYALLPYLIDDLGNKDPEFKEAFLKGYKIRNAIRPTEIQNEASNVISQETLTINKKMN